MVLGLFLLSWNLFFEGFLRGISELVPLSRIQDFTTIWRRINKLKLEVIDTIDTLDDEVAISIDASGMKVTNRGDWIRKKWKTHRKECFLARFGEKNNESKCPRYIYATRH
jgi:hypothetical protein